jgi:transposase
MEKELITNNYRLSPKGQEELRKKIVRQMKKHGNSKEVAEICECTVRHVNKTWKKYQEGGIKAILAVKMGYAHGKRRKLTPEQESSIKTEISEKNPREAGLSGYLWERAEVCELVKRRFGIEMPLSTMGDYLARWNFTYQRPKKRITVKTKLP